MTSIQYSLKEISQVAKKLLSSLPTRCVVLIEGEMGVGKTTLMSALLGMCGIQDVSSPTYSIVNEYLSDQGKHIHHYDLYRIQSLDELYELGFTDLLDNADWHFIEWPAVGAPFYPANAIHWKIEIGSNQERSISIKQA
jgi:tRNA threonylcarbamoyladenosine biosynthesis protein TsaE